MKPAGKAELRERLLAWRRTVSLDDVRGWSRELRDRLLAAAVLKPAGLVFSYHALVREPQTADLERELRSAGVGLARPLVVGRGLQPRRFDPAHPDLDAAALAPLDPLAVDAVLVPGLGFDAAGGRLGRGGGHYDRLLAELRPDCVRIGLCFHGQLLDRVPSDPWDQPVDWIVTERGLWRGRRRVGSGG